MLLPAGLLALVMVLGSGPSAVAGKDAAAPKLHPPERFRLFPNLMPTPHPLLLTSDIGEEKRLFHQVGDPDSLFSFGQSTPQGELRLKAALELNDVLLRGLPPEAAVDPKDTRGRSAGSYSPLDKSGRPYQLRLGARLVW